MRIIDTLKLLDKEDLAALVKGKAPYYSVFDHPLIKKYGSWTGGHVDEWKWNYNLELATKEELMEIYLICKESWN